MMHNQIFKANLKVLVVVVFLVQGQSCSQQKEKEAESDQKPNVLFIISDDLNDAFGGLGGYPQAATPNLDKLARQSVSFTNAHSNNPVCAPSRASVFTGLYPHTTGYYGYAQDKNKWYNNPVLKQATPMFEHFNRNGYNAYGTGKLFHHAYQEMFQRADGFDGHSHTPKDVGPFAFNGKEKAAHPSADPALGSGGKWPEFMSYAPLSDIPEVLPDESRNAPGYKGWVNRDGSPFQYTDEDNRDLMSDEKHARWATNLLQQSHDKPFVIAVGFHRPHSPWYAPKSFFEQYPLEDIELPPYKEDDLEDVAPMLLQHSYEPYRVAANRFNRLKSKYSGEVLEKAWKHWIQAYLACVSFVDHQVGKVLDALAKSEYAGNTIVVFTSDHGYHKKKKNRIWKRSLWQEASRVPLFIKVPGTTDNSAVVDHPVSLIDIYPTLADLCGLPENPHQGSGLSLDGFSLRPFLTDPETENWGGPDVALSSINGLVDPGLNKPGKIEDQHFSVRSKNFRYTLTANGQEELYDHRTDPNEWHNIAGDTAYNDEMTLLRKHLIEMTGRINK